MGTLIQFKPNRINEKSNCYTIAEKDIQLITLKANLKALKQEQTRLEAIITEKCQIEIAKLNVIDSQIREIEKEIENYKP